MYKRQLEKSHAVAVAALGVQHAAALDAARSKAKGELEATLQRERDAAKREQREAGTRSLERELERVRDAKAEELEHVSRDYEAQLSVVEERWSATVTALEQRTRRAEANAAACCASAAAACEDASSKAAAATLKTAEAESCVSHAQTDFKSRVFAVWEAAALDLSLIHI